MAFTTSIPENVTVNGVPKLIPNHYHKTCYVLHHRNLRQYLKYGMKLTKIHRGVKYRESTFLNEYISWNTKSRQEAASDFEKDFYKLMNNSVFGKTIENVRKIVSGKETKTLEKLIAKPHFKSSYIFEDSELVSIRMGESTVTLDKPIYLEQAILDISKTLMYEFHYEYIKPKYSHKANLLFMDTDSLSTRSLRKTFTKTSHQTFPHGLTPRNIRKTTPAAYQRV